MTPRTFGIVLLKLWGLMSLVDGFVGILSAGLSLFAPAVEPGMSRYLALTSALGAVVNLALGAVLLIGASRLVGMLEPEDNTPDDTVRHYGLAELQSLSFGAVGVFFAVSAMRDIATLIYAIARQPAWDSSGQWAYLLESRQEQLAGAAVQLVFAIVLVINRSALASWWSRVRPMASQSKEE